MCATPLAVSPQAHGQNLISDPYFAIGVPQTGFVDGAGNYFYTNNAASATFDGTTGAVLSGASSGSIEIYPLAGYDTADVNYAFTFFAAALNPDLATTVYGIFGPTAGPVAAAFATFSLTSTTLTKYTITGSSTSAFGNTGYVEILAQNRGDVFVTGLQFEPAPAPKIGGGILSLAMLAAGIGARTIRQRIIARR